ncbi:MAG: polyamine ABC transporter substrate-binding protein [Alphaproteobacteria bacterium]
MVRKSAGLALAAALVSGAVAAMLSGPAAADDKKVVNVYNWSDYITEDTLKKFTAETGIEVRYDVYDNNDILDAKLLAGNSGYDVVFPTATPYFAKQIQAKALMKLDKAKLPNAAKVDPKVLQQLRVADPDNSYGLPYMMAGTGVGYNVAKVKAAMPDAPLGSLAMLFDPAVLGKLEGCGVTLLDSAEETFPAALAWLGKDPTSTAREDLDAAAAVLTKARLRYRYIHSSAYINDLANGATCVAMGYAGDLVQARERAKEAKNGVEIAIFLPKEASNFNVDVMAIPADAPNVENAYKFIDFLLRPEVIGPISVAVGYANAVPEAEKFMDKAVLEDPAVYPPKDAKLYTLPVATDAFQRDRTRLWTRIKAKRK